VTIRALVLDLLPTPVVILRLDPAAPYPAWMGESRSFFTASRTPTELSIVADAHVVPQAERPAESYRAFRVRGPLPHDLVGIFASLAGPLAEAGIPIFPIATHETDYVLVAETLAARAARELTAAGHSVHGS